MIKRDAYKVIGVMSGTSLDGIDLVYVAFIPKSWKFEILASETIPYSKAWQGQLKEAFTYAAKELRQLDENYSKLLADIIIKFISDNSINELDAVCSHGHTIWHQPEQRITYQIGNMSKIASLLGECVVCDFRVQDVALGGQGAPLVPIGDRLLFSSYDYCLNLGGFANISFERDHQRIAFDICPVNIVLNYFCETLGLDYDDKGQLASGGNIHSKLLDDLNAIQFYKQAPPKSLGFEWVEDQIFSIIESYKLAVKDILRTFVEHIAIQISESIKGQGTMLVTGGGVYNDFLMSRIKQLVSNNIIIPSKKIIEYKEALIFGLLGVLKLRQEVNCLSSVTGATHDHSSGKIFLP